MSRYTDLAYTIDEEGLYDLEIDPDTGDFVVTDGLESALFVSLFSDRRAYEDEVRDPLKRRGWIGDLVSDVPGDRFGSGLWLYEQRRLTGEVAAGVRIEAEAALNWMVQDGLARTVQAAVLSRPADRAIDLAITIALPDGGTTSRAYVLADATRYGLLTGFAGWKPPTEGRKGVLEWGGEKLSWPLGDAIGWRT